MFRTPLLIAAAAAICWCQEAPAPGPAVGAHAPDFRLSDQNGRERDLRSLSGRKGLMLVFFRSADW